MDDNFIGTSEAGELIGVSRSRVDQLSREYDDFPEPAITLPRRRIWKRADVVAWLERHPDRPTGRPPNGA